MKILTVVGARPQFVKAAAVSQAIRSGYANVVDEVLVHTGQHYDENMSAVFFDELEIPKPRYNLAIAGGNHGAMTGRMLGTLEDVIIAEQPDWVLVYGDTNSTLAGALAAAKLHFPVAHVEAGLRSFNMRMPEEINRIVADRLSTVLFCPTEGAVRNLASEGRTQGVHNVGDVMWDIVLRFKERARRTSNVLQQHDLIPKGYVLVTCHRAENTDDLVRLNAILSAFATIAERIPVVFPVHPRSRKLIDGSGLGALLGNVKVIEPQSFLDMLALEQDAAVICTDSGGMQKEAFFLGVPCVTTRDETEWTETVELGANQLAGCSREAIVSAVTAALSTQPQPERTSPYGEGKASEAIIATLVG